MYFSSTRMDAGWFRTSPVVACHKSWNGHEVVLDTENSVYFMKADTDGEDED